jgi:hypothetical protein
MITEISGIAFALFVPQKEIFGVNSRQRRYQAFNLFGGINWRVILADREDVMLVKE